MAALGLLPACSPPDAKESADGASAAEAVQSGDAKGEPVTATLPSSSAGSDSTSTKKDSRARSTSSSTTSDTTGKPKSKRGRDSTASTTRASSDTKLYRVIRVVDGDTVEVDIDGGETVRVIGIDTPETVHPDKPEECGGVEATAAARALLDGKKVAVVRDETQDRRDRYGRLLAYLDIPTTGDFGEAMLWKGHAKEYTYAKPYQRRLTYRSAEQQARTADRGIWGSCSTTKKQDKTPTQTTTPETSSTPAPSPTTQTPKAPAKPKPPAKTKPPAPAPTAKAPGPGWTNDALTPGYTGCRQGYPGGKINGVYWWKPTSC